MSRPSKEEIAAARARLRNLADLAEPIDEATARVLLAATEPPTDKEIAEEAARFIHSQPDLVEADTSTRIIFARGYRAGVRYGRDGVK